LPIEFVLDRFALLRRVKTRRPTLATGSYAARRCCLSVPGSDRHKIERAVTSGADEIVLDLEDSVPPDAKAGARALVSEWLVSAAGTSPHVAVRVNAPRTRWCHDDIAACAAPGGPARSIVVPKVESAGDLAFVDRLLDGVELASGRTEPVTVQALIETAAGLMNLAEIVTASPRLRTVILGYADLGASLGRSSAAGLDTWLPAQHSVLVAARSAGIAAIDGPFLAVDTGEEFAVGVARAARLGFDGKWAIHPRQIGHIVTAFTPAPDEVAYAHRVLDALAEAHGRGIGAVRVDGQMIDEALAVSARRTIARAGADV
jgi:citrate lyase subunit beta/citryl-CoA lyase